jgi:hypothetical protein
MQPDSAGTAGERCAGVRASRYDLLCGAWGGDGAASSPGVGAGVAPIAPTMAAGVLSPCQVSVQRIRRCVLAGITRAWARRDLQRRV